MPATDPVIADMVSQLSEHLQELWQERAAIRQYDGNHSRELSKAMAVIDVIRLHTQEVMTSWL